MRVVAITELSGDLEVEAPHLATLLGVSPYDVKTRLSGAMPSLLLQTPDRVLSERVRNALVARGHAAVECELSAAVPSDRMIRLHRFALEAGGVRANDSAHHFLAWGDLRVVILATIRAAVSRTVEEIEYEPSESSSMERSKFQLTKTEHSSAHHAYLFPDRNSSSPTPWLLDEATAQFLSLGPRMQATRPANFLETLKRIRELAPHVIVDDRFVASPQTSAVLLQARGNDPAPRVAAGAVVDLRVHLLAEWLMRPRGGPYRG